MALTNGNFDAWQYVQPTYYYSTGTTTTWTTPTVTMAAGSGTYVEPVAAKKKTAIDWLNEQVEAMCSVAREALPA